MQTTSIRLFRPLGELFRFRFSLCRGLAAAGLLLVPVQSRAADALENWEQTAPGKFSPLFSSVAFGNGTFVATGANGLAATSPDGFEWTPRSHGRTAQYRSVIFAQGKFVAGGNNTPVLESPDGVTWTADPGGAALNIYGIAHGNGTFVAVGFMGGIWTSPNGQNWTPRTSGTFSRLESVAYGNGLFVATGLSGTILTSPTGETWTSRNSRTTEAVYAVTFGNGTFVAVTADGSALTSPDGIDWTPGPALTGGADLEAVTWGNGFFVAAGRSSNDPNGAQLWTSPDGANWTRRNSRVSRSLNGVAFGSGRFVAVGEAGTIIRSGVLGAAEEGVRLQNPRRNGAGMEFIFNSQPGKRYQVEYSTDLHAWLATKTVTADGPVVSFSELVHNAPLRFYRVQTLAE